MAISLSDLAANEELRAKVFTIWDIDIPSPEKGEWITIDGATDFTAFARDGSGGLFIVTPSSPRIIYASSEGQAGVIAADLEELMTLVVTCPYWADLLKYSGKDNSADEVRRAAPFLEEMWVGEEEDFAEACDFLKSELGIMAPDDLIGALHRAVSTPVDVRFHGHPAAPLFGRFTIDDNPFYRRLKGSG